MPLSKNPIKREIQLNNLTYRTPKGYIPNKKQLEALNLGRYKGKHHSEKTKRKLSEIQKGKHNSPTTEFKKDSIPWNKGKRGIMPTPWNKNLVGIHLSPKTEFKRGINPWNKNKPYLQIRREKHPRWKGGITSLNQKIRHSLEYKQWRKAVFEQDNYTCRLCGRQKTYLEADHIKPFANFPELRFDVNNGRTLCVDCHNKNKGWKN